MRFVISNSIIALASLLILGLALIGNPFAGPSLSNTAFAAFDFFNANFGVCPTCSNNVCLIAPGGGTGTGTLNGVNDIPDVLKPIFTNAGNAFNVSPAFIAAIYWKEHGRSFPTEGPWACSDAGACGPFQFIPSTWAAYAQDGDGDGNADINSIPDAAFAASKMLGADGAAGTTDVSKLEDAASIYNSGQPWSVGQSYSETANYVPDVISAYQKFTNEIGGGS